MPRGKPPSPTLSAVAAAIDDAAAPLITGSSGFAHTFEVDIDAIATGPEQPRTRFDADDLEALAHSLREHGQLQPILLRRDPERRNGWILVAGERRLRAARKLGWTRILAVEAPSRPEVIALVENLQRSNLTPLEEARGIHRMIEQLGLSQREAARLLGKHESDISRIQRILTLPAEFLEQLERSGKTLDRELLVELARFPDGPAKERLLRLALQDKLTVRAVREARESTSAGQPRPLRANPAAATRTARKLLEHIRLIRDQNVVLSTGERDTLELLFEEIQKVLARG